KLQISAAPAVNAARGKTGITKTKDYRGEEVLAAYTYIPETGWGFVCKQDLYELNAPIREMVLNFVILFLISAMLIYFVAFFIGNNISKPIIGMDVLSKNIRAGDLSVRNKINSQDELGSLAESINEMAISIESRINIQEEVAGISTLMVGLSSIQEFGTGLLEQLMETTKANMGTFYILNEVTSEYEHFVSVGANKELFRSFSADDPEGEFGFPITNKKISYLHDIPEDTIFKFPTTIGDIIPKEIITIPVLSEDEVIALISLVKIHKFDKNTYDILKQSWMSINTSYSNILGNEKTRILAESLSKTNQQLEAQTEELQAQSEELQSQATELQQTSAELQEQNLELDMQRNEVEEASRLKSQ
ncbi:MAG: HAMP domain-containing protein, partial [Candidatus Aminicenantes bacterium]|nr:HAMP domain-containing protein [Candidatus Aminicenantes bacterium]